MFMQNVRRTVQHPATLAMTTQQHADHLLAVWQQHRDLPPEKRLPPESFRASVEAGS